MRGRRVLAGALVAAAVVGVASTAGAGNVFSGATSTADGYETSGSDLVDADGLSATGKGVYVAVLDTGLAPSWKEYFPRDRVAEDLGKGFVQSLSFKAKNDQCAVTLQTGSVRESTFVGSSSTTHGTHVASTVIGFSYRSSFDALEGYPLPPIQVRGIAPDATVIPIRVLADYQLPALPKCSPAVPAQTVNFGTSAAIAAGIDYATSLAQRGYRPMVVNLSLGGLSGQVDPIEQAAIDRAIAAGVVVVAAASNGGERGLGSPGSYPPVITVGAVGWTREWVLPTTVLGSQPVPPRYRMFWLQGSDLGLPAGSGEVVEGDPSQVYVAPFSARALVPAGQQLDVMAPGSAVRGPGPGDPGYRRLPWWSNGLGDVKGPIFGNFRYASGTSQATPYVSAIAALLLEEDPSLTQDDVAQLLTSTALPLPSTGSAVVHDGSPVDPAWVDVSWDTDCSGVPCDPVGAGLVQAAAALAAIP